MKKDDMMKMIIFFSVTFIIILTVMTLVVGSFRPAPADVSSQESADSTATQSDSLLSANPDGGNTGVAGEAQSADTEEKFDSLKTVLQEYKRKIQTQQKKQTGETAQKPSTQAKQVAKIYEKMGAEDAANILAGLQIREAAEIISFMNKRQAAKILAAMQPEKAVAISKIIAHFN